MLSIGSIKKQTSTVDPPAHHVIHTGASEAASGWASYLPSWAPSPARTRPSLRKTATADFRNPWPSWHKPTLAETWDSFRWGEDDDGYVELAASHLKHEPTPPKPEPSKRPRFSDINDWPDSMGAKAARLLCIEDPNFSFPPGSKAKVTWLGHAGVLVQLPPLSQNSRPVRCVFDPMFSNRCSPSQFAGPIRSYPPPCRADGLPQIDAVFLSHNHFDHMDFDSLMSIWNHNQSTVRFFVPLQNKKFLLSWGIPADRIIELDWWDSVALSADPISPSSSSQLHIWCTPAQHNSFRTTGDANTSLWSSWFLELLSPSQPPYRVFFAGDTGYQFHPSPSWPPSPSNPNPIPLTDGDEEVDRKFPPCPAFAEIRDTIGPPNLLLLPISVGATYAYLRSFVPLRNQINPFPRHAAGVTGANHMPAWDAVRVLRVMTGDEDVDGIGTGGGKPKKGSEARMGKGGSEGEGRVVAVAMHWGTFVTDPEEVLRTLGQLEWACKSQGVRFARGLSFGSGDEKALELGETKPVFVALNHGESVCL
ncbi:hypothetical protein VTI74DRAFT_1016 [Chaetomium olivicolor]